MANETLKYCDLGPAIIGEDKYRELNASVGAVGGASDLGPAFLSPEPEQPPALGDAALAAQAEHDAATKPKAAPKKRAR